MQDAFFLDTTKRTTMTTLSNRHLGWRELWLLTVTLGTLLSTSEAFANLPQRHLSTLLEHSVSSNTVRLHATVEATSYAPIFDFSSKKQQAVENFERIDDAIMGGISLSALKDSSDEGYARWSGVCRLDGGGFCGTRTLPFAEPIQVGPAEGLYISCRLTSDDEPERRVWKITTRTEQSRGEQLYQAMFTLPKSVGDDSWQRILVPFQDFVQVRGPRIVETGEPLNTSNGLFQIGLSLSKFVISKNVTEVENFRPGFFELQVQEIGAYSTTETAFSIESPATLEKGEIEKKRPILLKILRPLLNVLFNEKRRRRKSAMGILRKRGMSTIQASVFGLKEALLRTLTWITKIFVVFPAKILLRGAKFLRGLRTRPESQT